jgi:hypothetical protein
VSLRSWLVRGPFGRLVRESTLYHYAVFGDPERLVIEPGADVNDARGRCRGSGPAGQDP